MKTRYCLFAVAALASTFLLAACGSFDAPQGPSFEVQTQAFVNNVLQNEGGVYFSGFTSAPGNGYATNIQCCDQTGSNGLKTEPNMAVPNTWTFTRYASTYCPQSHNITGNVGSQSVVRLPCDTIPTIYSSSPGTMNWFTFPSHFSISGAAGSFTGQYGAPLLELYDGDGSIYATWNANSVAGDGSSLQANTPDITQLEDGTYDILVMNMNADGITYTRVGGAMLRITTNCNLPPPNSCA